MIPGEYFLLKEDIICNLGKETTRIKVVNTGDRPVQVGSHFHFFEANRHMEFDRRKALGKRLNIPAGTAVRFEPGEEKDIELIAIGGKNLVVGINNLVNGGTIRENEVSKAMNNITSQNFKNKIQ
jgi:urease beta subunit